MVFDVVSIAIDLPCVIVGIPLSIACETMYVTIVVEVSIGVVVG